MAKTKDEKTESADTPKVEYKRATVQVMQEKEAPKKTKRPMATFTFDRWFASLGRPIHHKAGMLAYLSKKASQGKKTVAEWERLFASY